MYVYDDKVSKRKSFVINMFMVLCEAIIANILTYDLGKVEINIFLEGMYIFIQFWFTRLYFTRQFTIIE